MDFNTESLFYYLASVTTGENSPGSLTIYYVSFRVKIIPAFSRLPFQSYMLSNNAPRPMFSAISQE
jgi:hypothetical protein